MKDKKSNKFKRVLIKVGGNALTNQETKNSIVDQICTTISRGTEVILVHGGGIEIQNTLSKAGIQSEFVGGHRKTDIDSILYIEMVLSSKVNKELVSLFSKNKIRTVGISGKDGFTAIASKRYHTEKADETEVTIDLGFVGDIKNIDPSLILTLLDSGYLPIVSPISFGEDGQTYNVNADMFAAHLAAALDVDKFVAMTNINGLLKNVDDSSSIINKLTVDNARELYGEVIKGGMIPKMDACLIALNKGVSSAHIINGTDGDSLLRILHSDDIIGTEITQT